MAVDAHHREHDLRRGGHESFTRGVGFRERERPLFDGKSLRLNDLEQDGAGNAAQDGVIRRPRHDRAGM